MVSTITALLGDGTIGGTEVTTDMDGDIIAHGIIMDMGGVVIMAITTHGIMDMEATMVTHGTITITATIITIIIITTDTDAIAIIEVEGDYITEVL